MDIINKFMSGGNIIINNENDCLLSPSIKCNDANTDYLSYSSKILPNQDKYDEYMQTYNNNYNVDRENKYLIQLSDSCNVDWNKINECSNLNDIDNNNIKNIITEESYSLQNYIDTPRLLKNFIQNEPEFLKIFLFEFKNLFEGLTILNKKGFAHLKINPQNIIFNQQTKKMKFINFGIKQTKEDVIDFLNENVDYKYDFDIYYPFISFFANYRNYLIYKRLTEEKNKDFINFLKNIFFDENYNETNISNSRDLYSLKEQFITMNMINHRKFIKYKSYIKSHYAKDKTNFFHGILTYNQNNHIKNTHRPTFLKYIVNAVDIYGLSKTLLVFSTMLKDEYSIDINIYNELLECFNNLAINFPSPKLQKTCIPEKSFNYFKLHYNNILKYLSKKQQPNNNNINNNNTANNNILQYKLKSKDITTYNGNLNKNYVEYNGKLMRTFKPNDIFTHLNNLSLHNYSIIKKIIDNNLINRLNILIDKEAYHKIKYNLHCSDDKEVNIYTKKCVTKCPRHYRRNFNDVNFKCTRKNINDKIFNDKIFNDKIIYNKNNKNKKNKKNKNKDAKTKKCPPGYDKNPFTGACTRKCSPGYIRNLKFNCVAKKDVL